MLAEQYLINQNVIYFPGQFVRTLINFGPCPSLDICAQQPWIVFLVCTKKTSDPFHQKLQRTIRTYFPSEVVPQFRKLHRTLRYKDKMRADFGTTQPKTPNSYCAPQHCLMIKIALLCNVQCLSADIQLCSKLEATQGIPWTCDQRRQPSSKNETPKKSIQKVF